MTHSLAIDFPQLGALPAPVLDDLSRRLRIRTIPQSAFVVEHDDCTRDVYFLKTGRMLAVHITEQGREILFSVMTPGDFFGELAALDSAPRSVSIYASEQSEVGLLLQRDFARMMQDHEAFRDFVILGLTTRIRALTDHVHSLIADSMTDRLAWYIVRRAGQSRQLHAGAALSDFPTHAEIANHLGVNREAVSRAMGVLRDRGAIKPGRKSLTVLEPRLLEPGS